MKVRGSLTVEAALVIPIVLFCILAILNQGLELYGEAAETIRKQDTWEDFNPAEQFRKLNFLEEITGW